MRMSQQDSVFIYIYIYIYISYIMYIHYIFGFAPLGSIFFKFGTSSFSFVCTASSPPRANSRSCNLRTALSPAVFGLYML